MISFTSIFIDLEIQWKNIYIYIHHKDQVSLKKGARITHEMIFKLRSSQIEQRTRRPGFFLGTDECAVADTSWATVQAEATATSQEGHFFLGGGILLMKMAEISEVFFSLAIFLANCGWWMVAGGNIINEH